MTVEFAKSGKTLGGGVYLLAIRSDHAVVGVEDAAANALMVNSTGSSRRAMEFPGATFSTGCRRHAPRSGAGVLEGQVTTRFPFAAQRETERGFVVQHLIEELSVRPGSPAGKPHSP